MSDEPLERFDLDRDDEDLSALLDGELSPEREAQLRARMAREPDLTECFALLAQADQQVRSLAGATLAPERLAGLRAALDRRLAGRGEESSSTGRVLSLPRAVRWMAPAAAALAAGLTLYLALERTPEGPATPETASEPRAETRPPSGELARLSEEEIAIALDYETLSDFEVIEQLEFLELLAALDVSEPM